MIRKAVVGIVFDGKHFLVLHRVLGWSGWEFSKGGVDEGEDEEQAVLREIKEETGLDVEIIEKVPFVIKYDYPEDYKKKYGFDETEQSVFLAKTTDKKVRLSEEHDEYKWLDYNEARKILTHSNQKDALDKAWEILKGEENADTENSE